MLRPGRTCRSNDSVDFGPRFDQIDQNGVAIPDSALIWRRNWVDGPVLGTGRSISANIVGTQVNPTPGSPITFQIFLTALDGMRNLGSASETITITTTVVPCP